jgi:exopolysaccharide biosynthesis polyprenyl glycosylphosphotransferase
VPGIELTPFLWLLAPLSGAGAVTRLVHDMLRLLRHTPPIERVLVIGSARLATQLSEEIETLGPTGLRIIGIVDDGPGDGRGQCAQWLGPPSRLAAILRAHRPDRIVMARSGPVPADLEGPLLTARLQGVPVDDGVRFYERATGKLAIESLSPRSLILSDGFRHSDFVPSDAFLALTRALNLFAATLGLLLAAPLLALVALAIVLDSAGPVLFIQQRIGQGGRPFGLWKFRTMQGGTRSSEWVRDNGHRITRVGRWLRRFRLDELPQLVNVLRGEMNLVGPRPHPVTNFKLFLERIPYYVVRTAVRPGITGWAQVQYGYANGLEEETEKMRYDLYYIKHRSLWLDCLILVETAGLLLFNSRSHEAAHHRAPAAVGASSRRVRLST